MGLFFLPRSRCGDSQPIQCASASSAISAYRLDARTHARTVSDDASAQVWTLIAFFLFLRSHIPSGVPVCGPFVRSGVIDQATMNLHSALVIPLYDHHSNIQTALLFDNALDEPTLPYLTLPYCLFLFSPSNTWGDRGGILARRGHHVHLVFNF